MHASYRHWSTLKDGCERLSHNVNKTKVLKTESTVERMECQTSLNGELLEQVNELVYLRCMLSRYIRHEMDAIYKAIFRQQEN